MSTNQLLFPVAYWDGPAPEHEITALVKGANYLVSGSATGELVYWKPEKPGKGNEKKQQEHQQPPGPVFVPQALLMREASQRCTALVRCQLGSTEIVIAATSEGYLTTWAATGGRCFHSRAILPFAPTQILSFEWDGTAYLACAGETTDVHIVQLSTLQLVKVLRHRHPVVSIVLTPPAYAPSPFLFVLTSEGILYLWDLALLIPGTTIPSLSLDPAASSLSAPNSPSPTNASSGPAAANNPAASSGGGSSSGSTAVSQSSTGATGATGTAATTTTPVRTTTNVGNSGGSSAAAAAQAGTTSTATAAAAAASPMASPTPGSKDAMWERHQQLTIQDAIGEKLPTSPKHAALIKREAQAQTRIAREPSHSIHFPHLPSPPVGLAIAPDASCFIICLQRHWTVCSLRSFRPLCPMMENPLFAVTGSDSANYSSSSSSSLSPPASPTSAGSSSSSEAKDGAATTSADPAINPFATAASIFLSQLSHRHRHAPAHTGSRGKHVGSSSSSSATNRLAADSSNSAGGITTPPPQQQQQQPQDPYAAAMLKARGFAGCAFVDPVDESGHVAAGGSVVAPPAEKRVALWTGAGHVFCYAVSLVRSRQQRSTISIDLSVATGGSAVPSPSSAGILSPVPEARPAENTTAATAAATTATTSSSSSSSSSLSCAPSLSLSSTSACSAAQQSLTSPRQGRTRNLPRPTPVCFFSLEGALAERQKRREKADREKLERWEKEREEEERKRKQQAEGGGEVKGEKKIEAASQQQQPSGGLSSSLASCQCSATGVVSDWDGTARLPLACVLAEGDLVFIGSATGVIAAFKVPSGPVDLEAATTVPLEPYAVTAVSDAFPLESDPIGRANPCTASVLLKETTYIQLARGYKSGLVSVVRILAGPTQRIDLQGHSDEITSLVAIPSSESVTRRAMLISGSLDGTLRLWNLESNKFIGMFQCPSGVTSLHWHPPRLTAPTNAGPDTPLVPVLEAGDLLFAMCEDRAVRVFSLQSMCLVQTFPGHDSPIHAIWRDDWCVMSDHVVIQTKLGTVYVWVLSTGDLERCMEAGSQVAERFLYARGLHTSHLGRPPTAQPRKKPRSAVKTRIGLKKKESESAAAQSAQQAPQQPQHASAVKLVPLAGSSHLHLLLYVLNINKLLEELHTRYAILNKTFQRLDSVLQKAEGKQGDALAILEKESIDRRQALAELHMLQGMLSLLFDWGADSVMDKMLTEKLGLQPPVPLPAFGVLSDNGRAFTVLLPSQSIEFKPLGRWEFDPQFSARHALSLSTVCMSLLSSGDPNKQIYYSRIVSHYNVIMPDSLPTYVEPDIQVLAAFALNANEEVHTVARLLLQGVIERSTDAQRKEIVRRWAAFYNYELPTQDNDEKRGHHHHNETSASSSAGASESEIPLPGTGPVSDQELMTALVLCLIAVHEASKRKRRLMEERHQLEKRGELENESALLSPQALSSQPQQQQDQQQESAETKEARPATSEDDVILSSVSEQEIEEHMARSRSETIYERVEAEIRQARTRSRAEDTKAVAVAVSRAVTASSAAAAAKEREEREREREKEREKAVEIYGAQQEDDEELCTEVEAYAQYVVNTLLRALARAEGPDAVRCALACELLGKGFSLWKNYIVDLVGVIRRIHQLSLLKHSAISSAAHRALMEAGRIVPKYFIACMGKEAINTKASAKHRSSALIAIVALVRRFPEALAYVLPDTVQVITRCLDPSDPALRKSLLQSATAALHSLVQKYPMVSFHQETQRFAVGTGANLKSVIVIYDLRTATKFRILEGHTGPLTAVSFAPNGKFLVSYSADEDEPTVRVWNTGGHGWLSTLLGMQGKMVKMFKVPKTNVRSLTKKLQTCKIIWTPKNGVTLIREDGTQCSFQL